MRRAVIAKVQIARKELALDEDTYRDILEQVTGHRSAADASDDQLKAVLERFKSRGWKPKVVVTENSRRIGKTWAAKQAGRAAADHPAAKKARALWLSLWNLGEVRDPSEAALESFARRQLKVEQLQWADQALCYKLIEALKAMAERAGWSQDLSGVPGRLQVLTLKRRLLAVQIDRLKARDGAAIIPWDLMSLSEVQLDAAISAAGRALRTPEAAG